MPLTNIIQIARMNEGFFCERDLFLHSGKFLFGLGEVFVGLGEVLLFLVNLGGQSVQSLLLPLDFGLGDGQVFFSAATLTALEFFTSSLSVAVVTVGGRRAPLRTWKHRRARRPGAPYLCKICEDDAGAAVPAARGRMISAPTGLRGEPVNIPRKAFHPQGGWPAGLDEGAVLLGVEIQKSIPLRSVGADVLIRPPQRSIFT